MLLYQTNFGKDPYVAQKNSEGKVINEYKISNSQKFILGNQ